LRIIPGTYRDLSCSNERAYFMIGEKDKKIILDISKKYNLSRVLLFGSFLTDPRNARDIDIAVDGISDDLFFTFYGELMFALSKPVDVIDLSKKTKFTEMVIKTGVCLDS
jgi:predicted nucleotidyltransferase